MTESVFWPVLRIRISIYFYLKSILQNFIIVDKTINFLLENIVYFFVKISLC